MSPSLVSQIFDCTRCASDFLWKIGNGPGSQSHAAVLQASPGLAWWSVLGSPRSITKIPGTAFCMQCLLLQIKIRLLLSYWSVYAKAAAMMEAALVPLNSKMQDALPLLGALGHMTQESQGWKPIQQKPSSKRHPRPPLRLLSGWRYISCGAAEDCHWSQVGTSKLRFLRIQSYKTPEIALRDPWKPQGSFTLSGPAGGSIYSMYLDCAVASVTGEGGHTACFV